MRGSINQYEPDVDFFAFTSESQVGAKPHKDVPYGFKTYAVDMLRQKGYDQVLWMDASVWLIKGIGKIWEYISEHGVMCQPAGCWLGNWTNDRCLNHFGISRDEAMQIPMVLAGFQAFDFSHPITKMYFDQYHHYAKDGTLFRGNWTNELGEESDDTRCRGHRHDQSVASVLFHKLKMQICPVEFGVYVGGVYGHRQDGEICCWLQGMA